MEVLNRLFEAVAAEPDLEWVMLDATVIRAHAQAAGARRKGRPDAQTLGRSRGGFETKIHVCIEALGLPVRIPLGSGQQNDMAPACDLIYGVAAEHVLAQPAMIAVRLSSSPP